ncbi:Protein-L-isoaspartate O-methyltransferase [Novipirellula galeiformis]|uniref:Protein-L-isoaspartate O-methyltransferase n=1 Tax=Novipirellula galeiformis TaxID=2528004 RepID=A0A5C6C1Q4_9BACT|nr:protein-L-isoaspartate(D-aspartate) O-methyltransferase [Novipirellula galeiformis]TWU17436.1 Protein-L-isoaspartate O-methyltransferase [Novipirellula galeiformis]
MSNVDFDRQRNELVETGVCRLGVRDDAVLQAMRSVPREEFVSEAMREFAYRNAPLPIGSGQTISQPLIVAYMAEALELTATDRVLEIGAGSGYAAAVVSRIAKEVFTVERHRELADAARSRLERLGYDNVHVLHADGTLGWPEHAPFDAIVVSAGAPRVPPALLQQLVIGGRLVIPVGDQQHCQKLIRVTRRGEDDFQHEQLTDVRFVPLVGEAGWESTEE